MYDIKFSPGPAACDGHVDMSFRTPDDWDDYRGSVGTPSGSKIRAVLFGDADVGPMAILNSIPPTTVPLERGPAHSHDSDNWRTSILGTSSMGNERYGPGEFRLQEGGAPYGGDDVAWGPDGGYSIVMFADRRGFPARPVKHMPQVEESMRFWAEQVGVAVADPYPSSAAIATQLGNTDKAGKIEGSFRDATTWPENMPGTRMATAILGDRTAGPVLLLLQAKPAALAVPACTFETEVLHVVVAGACSMGDDVLERGSLRLQEAGALSDAIVAGPGGLSHAMIIGDRRAVSTVDVDETAPLARQWGETLASTVDFLKGQIGPDTGPRRRRRAASSSAASA